MPNADLPEPESGMSRNATSTLQLCLLPSSSHRAVPSSSPHTMPNPFRLTSSLLLFTLLILVEECKLPDRYHTKSEPSRALRSTGRLTPWSINPVSVNRKSFYDVEDSWYVDYRI
ncbi:hypothetical protein K435DRAFT_872323 [Dendrothele bispora CBS 962.96]|uniref:Uncharacterized protein n=1 Tax=Dendrothele bispora (strain CBS 962.96) TaxID=1314807 RepID=A0A4S8L299_DENBC|nr:hypothetical protein K435DRAFT_872323 [Dendrothele bispora CBS 962.96]